MLRISSVLGIITALVIGYVEARAADSIWNHNGSTVDLFADGANRVFRYRDPRSGMQEEGVTSGTILFQGHKSGNFYTGIAYVFSQRCAVAFPYAVSGAISSDQRQITLHGNAPSKLDAACRVVAYRSDVLRFDFLQSTEPPPTYAERHVSGDTGTVQDSRRDERQLAQTHVATPTPLRDSPANDLLLIAAVVGILALLAIGLAPNPSGLLAGLFPLPQFASVPASHASTMERTPMQLDTPSPTLTSLSDDLQHQVPPPTVAAGSGKIYLKLRRSQKAGMMGGKPTFVLDARADLSPEARALVSKYALGSLVVYDSKARQQRAESAAGHFDDAYVSSYGSVGRSLWKNARGLASAAMMALALRVTVNSLISGQHIACKDLDELLGAEAAIVEACKNLKAYLDTALTFDGREELLEF